MPMLTPGTDEEMAAFIARFMSDPDMVAEYPDEAQRSAVAYVQWGKQFLTYKNAPADPKVLRIKETYSVPDVVDDGSGSPTSRLVKGYASVSEIQDLEHDRIMHGAWGKTLQERVKSKKVPLMTKHLVTGGLATDSIGWMTENSREDSIGLWAEFEILRTTKASECYELCAKSLESHNPIGLSVEFYPLQYEPNSFGGYDIFEAKLLQVTLTTVPCNELSGVYAVKEATHLPYRKSRPDLRAKLARALLRYSLHTR